jgi:hypothetical protein
VPLVDPKRNCQLEQLLLVRGSNGAEVYDINCEAYTVIEKDGYRGNKLGMKVPCYGQSYYTKMEEANPLL